ncbi:MAG: hypothetical protein HS124_04810 [Anaerolineales bacterium]|nr:hypothetical protein [Anaerolineales bacterium]
MKPVRSGLAGVAARAVVEPGRDIESLRGRMSESERQVEGLFEALLALSFVEGLSEAFS